MVAFFSILAVAGYLGFLIDWRELRDILRQGGWGAAVIYCVVGILIYAVLITPSVIATSAGHH